MNDRTPESNPRERHGDRSIWSKIAYSTGKTISPGAAMWLLIVTLAVLAGFLKIDQAFTDLRHETKNRVVAEARIQTLSRRIAIIDACVQQNRDHRNLQKYINGLVLSSPNPQHLTKTQRQKQADGFVNAIKPLQNCEARAKRLTRTPPTTSEFHHLPASLRRFPH